MIKEKKTHKAILSLDFPIFLQITKKFLQKPKIFSNPSTESK